MASMLRGALIGVGNVAVHGHLPGWLSRQGVEIVAGTDLRPARRLEFHSRLPQARWYDSVDELLTGEALDFVDISTPPATHAALIRSALEHGLHVLCEKPLVCKPEDLSALVRLAAEADLVLYAVHNWLHAPVVRKVRDLVRQGAIGQVKRCLWQTLRTQPAATADAQAGNWRLDPAMAGGGILADHGWHVFYVLREWLGQAPIRIGARLETRRFLQWPLEDTATLWCEFPSTTAEVFLTWASDVRQIRAELEGTCGTIRVEDGTVVLIQSRPHRREQQWPCPPALSEGSHHPDWFGRVASGFIAEVKEVTARSVNLAEAALCVRLLTLAQESSRRGGHLLPVAEASPSATAPCA
jgi:predicted dehydrogenase